MKPHYSNTNNPIDFPKSKNKMNERIKQLMGKTLDSEFSHTWNTMTYEGLLQFSEKFAELIVKEMLQTCEDHPAWTGRMIGEQIKQHFGVEE